MAHTDTVATGDDFPFWDYTVPASGGRSALKVRVYRYIQSSTSYVGYISNVKILTKGTGWSGNDVFTIPGDQIGGATPANDITFGVQAEETSTNAGDGTPCVRITSLGAGSTFFQRADNSRWAVLKMLMMLLKHMGLLSIHLELILIQTIDCYSILEVDING